MTLTEFLLARIAEDEANIDGDWAGGDGGLHIISTPMRDRLLADCDAKRRIVEQCSISLSRLPLPLPVGSGKSGEYAVASLAMLLLALPYADHPDYRDEWRP